ncbi:hypothetical protein G9A89_006123 [Geosiphon pyriformis]|nr:hypothetical protein G9A89_006123 [Geosiphon pyriformis]
MSIIFNQLTVTAEDAFSNSELSNQLNTILTNLPANNITANISTTHISIPSLSTTITNNISTTTATNNLSDTCTIRIITVEFRNWNYLSLLVTPEDTLSNNLETNQKSLTNNILPATVIEDESLTAIFPFKIEDSTSTLLFSEVTLEEKPITTMYTDAKVNGHSIKLILNSESADSIITRQLMNQLADRAMKTPISKINNLPIKINGIIVPIKVLVMEATQYQALVGNDWLSKTNTTLDWNTQELQLSQNDQHTCVPAMCGHFKTTNMPIPLIKLEEKKEKPTWKAYQVSWADKNHNELLLILSWDDNRKEKQKKELTWNTNQAWETDNDQDKLTTTWKWKEDNHKEKKKKKKKDPIPITTHCSYIYNNCKDSLRENHRQWVDFSSASEKEYINTHNNQELKKQQLIAIKAGYQQLNITRKPSLATKTPNLTVLEFCRAIYTQNQSDLELPEECCPAESALTYYINARINYHIGKEEEPHDAKLGLYRELSQYTTKEVAVIAATIVKIHQEIEQYANENFPISTGNTREHANKTKENLETNQESNQQKLGTLAQTPKKTVIQSIKKQRIYSPEDKSYHFSPENKIQIPLGAASSSTSTSQTPRTSSYIDKIKQRNWGDIPITGGYSSLFQNPLFQPKFRTGFENCKEESESESKKETSEKTITKPVTGTSSQSRNQETRDQEEELDIREATFRNTQENIIPPPLRPINPPVENGNEMTTPYIARLTDFSGEEEETDVHTWLREAQKAIQANN